MVNILEMAVLVCMLPVTATVSIDISESMRHKHYLIGAAECTCRERHSGNLAKSRSLSKINSCLYREKAKVYRYWDVQRETRAATTKRKR